MRARALCAASLFHHQRPSRQQSEENAELGVSSDQVVREQCVHYWRRSSSSSSSDRSSTAAAAARPPTRAFSQHAAALALQSFAGAASGRRSAVLTARAGFVAGVGPCRLRRRCVRRRQHAQCSRRRAECSAQHAGSNGRAEHCALREPRFCIAAQQDWAESSTTNVLSRRPVRGAFAAAGAVCFAAAVEQQPWRDALIRLHATALLLDGGSKQGQQEQPKGSSQQAASSSTYQLTAAAARQQQRCPARPPPRSPPSPPPSSPATPLIQTTTKQNTTTNDNAGSARPRRRSPASSASASTRTSASATRRRARLSRASTSTRSAPSPATCRSAAASSAVRLLRVFVAFSFAGAFASFAPRFAAFGCGRCR